ncbi:DNA-formamidopyrimidine glycosylase [Candidatus Roizmanbacteria bacterium RIFCSPHIGHO2_12_FULL_41_11]|uniref:DNA-formamidopyrimidine glycosylase n=3 Tax=Candidatus Roizmaniibacteriota TaxID=1752723 RepID=A0A1F7JQE3_9BACT|nr:MAG: DNA-formamidopyrimidine glycosylase [Candidatus Roizmanbacteria bacterium RIFCSPHIGHO2_12_FULL_41_11]OGK51817.1 MAG: DNA-formamidopyrimidine glycosylase [Candidatus Roizmanbacteria bacterium RIFCSPLOWO2_01_FULL_41_22]OGK57817.1 MAG: DNA-formamidopyrimidine glycosylase [Candidatus Roizmanbacteria bacterium RIFCSPLOWO2_02_FULL_41_9]
MPELPEVETIRRYLEPRLVGKTIKTVEVLTAKQFIGKKEHIIGAKIAKIMRQGKVLIFRLSNDLFLNIHLKMAGQLLFAKNKNQAVYQNPIPKANTTTMPGRTTRIIIGFTDESALFFNDLRKFGWFKIAPEPLAPLSADVLSKQFSQYYFKKTIDKSNKPIKPLLMEQDKMAGIGNIYANEAVFVAGIGPQKKAKNLTEKETTDLYLAIKTVIAEGIKYKGSSSSDESYIQPDSSRGQYQHRSRVYHREGQPCLKCNTKIIRIKQNGRSTFLCPHCQK